MWLFKIDAGSDAKQLICSGFQSACKSKQNGSQITCYAANSDWLFITYYI